MGDLSANFSKSEFSCHCGCGADSVSSELVNCLQLLRDDLNEPIHVLSGVRCEFHNHKVGGTRHSQHILGNAADIYINGITPAKLYQYLDGNDDKFGIGGLGLYIEQGFVHVDVRKERARWHG